MILLALETASYAEASAALFADGKVVSKLVWPMGRELSSSLVSDIEKMLAGKKPDLIAVDRGPGSFTGIRTGLAAAQGLALGWGIELIGVPSFAFYPRPSANLNELLLLNARAGGGYYYEYREDGKLSAGYVSKEDIAVKFPACELYYGECEEGLLPKAKFVRVKAATDAESLGFLALEKYERGEKLPAEAIYLHLRALLPKNKL